MAMQQNVRKIVFIDLDHTLVDNQDSRLMAAQRALTILFPEYAIEQALSTYSTIVDHTDAFEALGFPSFRHYWNPVEIYAVLALLTHDNNFVKIHPEVLTFDPDALWVDLFTVDRMVCGTNRSGFFSDEDFYGTLLGTLGNNEPLRAFAGLVRKILHDPIFQETQAEYDRNLRLKPLEHVTNFLKRLQESGFLFYLVTEGLTQVQLEKVSLLGLQEFFNGRVLVTQAMAEPFEAEEIVKAAKDLASDRGRLLADDQRCLDYLTLSYFSSLIRRWSDKSNKQFYSRVLHAVQFDPMSPQHSLSKVEVSDRAEWLSRPPIKLAMIGDRYDKDLLPVLELCGKDNSITIRIQQGKYKSVPHPQRANSWRSPTATFEEFSEIEDFIFDPSNWDAIAPVPWPRIFDEPPGVQSAMYIERAKTLAIPSVQKLAKILENEQRSHG
jgi:FMN phosphatase YigB (HAD superfamily)